MKKILVVDDEPTLLKIFELESEELGGLEILTATTGDAAMKIISENKIDCVLTDLTMPKMGGLKLLRNIQDLKLDVPCRIVISGLPEEINQSELDSLGISNYFEKPFSIHEVLNFVKSNC